MIWLWVNQILSGILLGGYYALLACGLSLLFGVMRIINLAHGDLAVLSAFLVWVLVGATGMSPFLALAIAIPAMAIVGWALQRFMLERSLKAGMLVPLLSTFGLAIVIENRCSRSSAPTRGRWRRRLGICRSIAGSSPARSISASSRRWCSRSRWRCCRACRSSCGIPNLAVPSAPPPRIPIPSWSASIPARSTPSPRRSRWGRWRSPAPSSQSAPPSTAYAGPNQLIFAFEAVVIGGLGSLWGTLVGGIILGVAQNVGAQFDSRWFLLAGHITFLAVLALRLVAGALSARGGWRAVLGRSG